jgi:excisionase family DNA binding protein
MTVELFQASDIAKEHGDITPAAVRAAADRGEIPAIRTPRGVRLFTREAVDAFLEQRKARRALRHA